LATRVDVIAAEAVSQTVIRGAATVAAVVSEIAAGPSSGAGAVGGTSGSLSV
jgi:hypothetical protein